MAEHLRPGTTECYDFTPDDTDTEMYIETFGGMSMSEILEKAKEKWPEATLDNISITPKYIHTRAIYYDRYDASDWTNYLLIELKT